jgi:hypothetical protein
MILSEMRARLLKLISDSHQVSIWDYINDDFKHPNPIETLADDLLVNGVVPLPVKPGDIRWCNLRWAGDYTHIKSAPYPVEVIYVGLHNAPDFGGGYAHIRYKSGRVVPINFDEIDKVLFKSESEARRALEEDKQ